MLNTTKSKYLKSLGFFNYLSPTMGVIPESQNEYNDEILAKRKNNMSKESFTKDEVKDLITSAVKNNNIQQFRELMEQYDYFEVSSIGNSGWNALHYSSLLGHSEIVLELVTKHKANVNLLNVDGWSPLHLCSYKGHADVVRILLSVEETDVNMNINGLGTPLHCACKKNNLQVVSILLHRADFK